MDVPKEFDLEVRSKWYERKLGSRNNTITNPEPYSNRLEWVTCWTEINTPRNLKKFDRIWSKRLSLPVFNTRYSRKLAIRTAHNITSTLATMLRAWNSFPMRSVRSAGEKLHKNTLPIQERSKPRMKKFEPPVKSVILSNWNVQAIAKPRSWSAEILSEVIGCERPKRLTGSCHQDGYSEVIMVEHVDRHGSIRLSSWW